MTNSTKLPPRILNSVREFIGENRTDVTDITACVDQMNMEEVLNSYLEWQGVCGYTSSILAIIEAFNGKES